jgi:hypothetical protein
VRPRGLASISSGVQATYQAFFGNMAVWQWEKGEEAADDRKRNTRCIQRWPRVFPRLCVSFL